MRKFFLKLALIKNRKVMKNSIRALRCLLLLEIQSNEYKSTPIS